MRPFHLCIHDATPAFARETEVIIRDLAPLVGRRLSFGAVPDWHGSWPLAAHPEYCALIAQNSEEILLHGYFHQRRRGYGPASWLAEGSDEMNGLDPAATLAALERGQRIFTDAFGRPARGFLPPAWQRAHVRAETAEATGLEYVLGFFSLESSGATRVALATWTWDCGRWGWLGHVGHAVGRLLQSMGGRVPVLAIHPRDIQRGFWPQILRITEQLIDSGYQPSTLAGMLDLK